MEIGGKGEASLESFYWRCLRASFKIIKMFPRGISRGAENMSDPCFRKKMPSEKLKDLKQRSKALSDVKNTIHSHVSNLVEKSKNGDKKKGNGAIGSRKSTKAIQTTGLFNVLEGLEGENEIKCDIDIPEPEFECINHYVCENANNLTLSEFFDEYKLTEKELNCISNRMNFFRFDPPPFKINALLPVKDVELNFTNNTSLFHDEDLIDEISIEVPKPSYF